MHPKFKAWAQLLRIPNTLTACADSLAGFSVAVGYWHQYPHVWIPLVLVSMSSICLYWAGMVLNDVNDVEADRLNRRLGPIVDDRIPIGIARRIGWILLFMGVGFAFASTTAVQPTENQLSLPPWSVLIVAGALAISIVAYDGPLKKTWLGPLLMGLCRGWNLLLGFIVGACYVEVHSTDWHVIGVAVFGHILFVMGITIAARRESSISQSRDKIMIGWSTSLIGAACIAACSYLAKDQELNLDPVIVYPLLVALLCGPWLRRALYSIQRVGIQTLVPAIKQAILTIIFLDAALTLQFAGNLPGAVVCCLAIPTWFMARYFRMT